MNKLKKQLFTNSDEDDNFGCALLVLFVIVIAVVVGPFCNKA